MSKAPNVYHQDVSGNLYWALRSWDPEMRRGKAYMTPGVVFAEDDEPFFTMELVSGIDFQTYVRPPRRPVAFEDTIEPDEGVALVDTMVPREP